MSLYKEPLPAILDAIKNLNPGVELVQSEYTYGQPVVMEPDQNGNNTELTITASGGATPYEGAVTIRYKRLNLADLETLVGLSFRSNGLTTTRDLAAQLNARYGLNFVPTDVVDEPVALVDGSGQVILTAETNSLGWVGSVEFSVIPGAADLTQYLDSSDLAGLYYPSMSTSRPFANIYSYWRDFTAEHARLVDVLTGEQGDLTNVKDALVAITGDAWVLTGSSRFSLEGAEVIYNGVTSGDEVFNTDYQFGMVVRLSESNLGYSGDLILHYNDPFDEFD